MSWASRRRFLYLTGVIVFFAVIITVPLVSYLHQPTTCFDTIQNQGETAPDKGGPCQLLDERALIPHAIQWARGFPVRDGTWSAVAYVENPNNEAGILKAPYRFRLYDDRNVLVAEHEGVSYIMPGSITPVYEGGFDTGNRVASRTFFEFTAPLVWERLADTSRALVITGKTITDLDTMPRVSATAENTAVSEARDVEFVATVFDTAGNAIASSRTVIPLMKASERVPLVFTWPDPLQRAVGRVDILPRRTPIKGGT